MKLFTIEYWACGIKKWCTLCLFRGTFREALEYSSKRFAPKTPSRVRRVNSKLTPGGKNV